MLKKRSVTAKETGLKYALLALLASVVLPTTHTPQISHEHAEKIKDLEGVLAFPWGRLSFDLLMSSIKERNEVSLSQNTIALKGFVLALQLVMIEAVPALMEAVHEGGSSGSEGESADDEDVPDEERKGKRSISPGHARETDCAGKVRVLSIISVASDDCNGQSEFGWSGDEEDVRVQNLQNLIEEGFRFTHTSFTGGVSKADVAIMREETRSEAEVRKITKQKSNQRSSDVVDVEYIASTVKASVSVELNHIDTQMKIFADSFSKFETNIVPNIQDMLNQFRDEIVRMLSNQPIVSPGTSRQNVPETVPVTCWNNGNLGAPSTSRGCSGNNEGHTGVGMDSPILPTEVRISREEVSNSKDSCVVGQPPARTHGEVDASHIITNAMIFAENGGNLIPNVESSGTKQAQQKGASVDLVTVAESSNSPKGSATPNELIVDPGLVFPKPTFSLGLTQEQPKKGNTSSVVINEESRGIVVNEDCIGVQAPNPEAPCHPCRKSKRQKVVPKALVGDYKCEKTFLSRAWEAHVASKSSDDSIELAAKFSQLIEMLKSPFSYTVNGVRISSKDMTVMLEKSSHLPPKVVDLLIHHTRALYNSDTEIFSKNQSVFLDTKFVSQFSKTYVRFSKVGNKDSFMFLASLLESFNAACTNLDPSRYYFPFNFDKSNWVGGCIDATSCHLVVLDCNTSICSDRLMCNELQPFAVMFPYLLRQAGNISA
ncbi:unnamed protein product [Brassica oleracea var. botrytis]